jgi:pimeloyl-ACP methyl ester carboxylesterase
VLAVLALLAACSSGSTPRKAVATSTTASAQSVSAYIPVYAANACDPSIPTDPRVVCGTLTVPEERARPDGRSVKLAVATIHPKTAVTDPDPVVFLMGGPGASGLANIGEFLTRDFGSRDVIVFDQRGSGLSQPNLTCTELTDVAYAERGTGDLAERHSVAGGAFKACRDRFVAQGVGLASYNLAADIADMEDLRIAMGVALWNVWGMSYGTHVALEAARTHADRMRSLVLESVEPTTAGSFQPDFVTNGLRRLFDRCSADPVCGARYPTLEADLNQVVATLTATPYHGSISDAGGAGHPTVVTGADVLAMVWRMLDFQALVTVVPSTIEAVRHLDYAFLDTWAKVSIPGDDYATGMDISFECADDGAPTDSEATLADHPDYLSVLAVDIRNFCDVWDVPRVPSNFHEPVTFAVPTLIYAGEYDPNTPPQSGQKLAAQLVHSTYAEFPGLTHVPSFAGDLSACPRSIMTAFLDNPTATPSTSCVAGMDEPVWA